MKRLLYLIIYIALGKAAAAQTIVLDATDDYKTTRRVQLVKRLVITDDMESSTTDEEFPGLSIHALPELYREAIDKSPYTCLQDTGRQTIHTTFNTLYPDRSLEVRLNILGSDSHYQTVAAPPDGDEHAQRRPPV